ncbi:DUF7684 family protein [Peristeroidobacter agariperforans]
MIEYQPVTEVGTLPDVRALAPYKCVVIIESSVSVARQVEISRWLVDSGCLYMMAWGPGCSSWDDSVDLANLEQFDFRDVPEDNFVMTTWHESESLSEVFGFSKFAAMHPSTEMQRLSYFMSMATGRKKNSSGCSKMPNKAIESAPVGRPTRKSDALLLAAHR